MNISARCCIFCALILCPFSCFAKHSVEDAHKSWKILSKKVLDLYLSLLDTIPALIDVIIPPDTRVFLVSPVKCIIQTSLPEARKQVSISRKIFHLVYSGFFRMSLNGILNKKLT